MDRYIAKNFLVGYAIAFGVLIGLRIIVDLFVNLDEFTERTDLGAWAVLKHVMTFYALNATVYFRDLAGMITVVAAAFSLGKMVRDNELVAIMASGISARRIVGPILGLAIFFAGLWVADQELLIPMFRGKLARGHGDVPGEESFKVRFIKDGNGSLIFARRFYVKTSIFDNPTIITRRPTKRPGIWEMTGRITADQACFNEETGAWDLVNGMICGTEVQDKPRPLNAYVMPKLLPKDIPVMCESEITSLFSYQQLSTLAAQKANFRDTAALCSQRHFRITEPIINLTMLMISLPILIRRDPNTMKSAILFSFALTAVCFIMTFVCKLMATEAILVGKVRPELWAWLPVFVFLPIAFIELDAMQT